MREYVDSLRPEQRDLLRALGGLLLAAGAVALFIRKANQDSWGDFGRLCVLLLPCVLLYALGLGVADRELAPRARPGLNSGLFITGRRVAPAWQSVLLVLAIILVPLCLFQFLALVGGDSGDSLNTAWIFGLTAAAALYASFAAGVRYAALLGALSIAVAWLAIWDKVLDGPSATTVRWLLLVLAAGLVLAAVALGRRELRQAEDFVTGAGLAAVLAGLLGLISLAVQFVGTSISRAFGTDTTPVTGARQHQEWDVLLLVVSLALIWYGSRKSSRGPTYVGAIALAAFIVSVGVELTSLFAGGSPPEGALMGWPLLLLLVGGAGLGVGFSPSQRPPDEQPAQDFS